MDIGRDARAGASNGLPGEAVGDGAPTGGAHLQGVLAGGQVVLEDMLHVVERAVALVDDRAHGEVVGGVELQRQMRQRTGVAGLWYRREIDGAVPGEGRGKGVRQ